MNRFRTWRVNRGEAAMAAALLAACPAACAAEVHVSGRLVYGAVYRVEESDPALITSLNGAAIGLVGRASGGNADDANLNYRRGDAASRALKGYLDLAASAGDTSALVRLKAWHDYALLGDGRPWGNSPNGYAAGAPLSDAGAPLRSRFSGIAFGEAWVQQRATFGEARLTARLGQQNLNWGTRFATPGGLEALNPKDLPALHRAGAVAQETKVAVPMLFGRLDMAGGVALEAYYQTGFRGNVFDMCGSFWAISDYVTDGCNKIMSGQPQVTDRARLPLGAYMGRLPTPKPGRAEFGVSAGWQIAPGFDAALYHARYNSRIALPGLRRTTRPNGPALIPGNPDGRNMAYFTEYPEGLAISAASFTRKSGANTVYGELSWRPRTPFMISPGDVVPPFLSPTAIALLRDRANAVPPGGLFHGFDLHPLAQAQLGVQHELALGSVGLTLGAEVVAKHTPGLPDQALQRYGRSDLFGVGPVQGVCPSPGPDPVRQCTLRGYTTADSFAYRLRGELRLPALAPGLASSASVAFAHDVRGWSGDLLINEGRKTAVVALRFEYLQRYVADVSYMPIWGGDYNVTADRDAFALSLGIKF